MRPSGCGVSSQSAQGANPALIPLGPAPGRVGGSDSVGELPLVCRGKPRCARNQCGAGRDRPAARLLNCGDGPHNKECVTQNVSSAKGENKGCWGRSWAGVLGLTASSPLLTRRTRSIGRPWPRASRPHPCLLTVRGPRQSQFRAPAGGGGMFPCRGDLDGPNYLWASVSPILRRCIAKDCRNECMCFLRSPPSSQP